MSEPTPPKDQNALRRQRWDLLVGRLSSSAQSRLSESTGDQSEEELAFESFQSRLSVAARAATTPDTAISKIVSKPDAPPDLRMNYVLVEQIDSEWLTVRTYQKPKQVAERIAELEASKTDACVAIFYGLTLPLSKGPDRVILLPDDSAIRVRNGKIVRSLDEKIEIQDDNFIGPPDMAPTITISADDSST